MQKVFFLSGVTYEWTQVTRSWALVLTTVRHTSAPASFSGSESVSGKVRSTRYRGILFLLSSNWDEDLPHPHLQRIPVSGRSHIGSVAYLGRCTCLFWRGNDAQGRGRADGLQARRHLQLGENG